MKKQRSLKDHIIDLWKTTFTALEGLEETKMNRCVCVCAHYLHWHDYARCPLAPRSSKITFHYRRIVWKFTANARRCSVCVWTQSGEWHRISITSMWSLPPPESSSSVFPLSEKCATQNLKYTGIWNIGNQPCLYVNFNGVPEGCGNEPVPNEKRLGKKSDAHCTFQVNNTKFKKGSFSKLLFCGPD